MIDAKSGNLIDCRYLEIWRIGNIMRNKRSVNYIIEHCKVSGANIMDEIG